ncbi:MAG: hypothetical protein ACYDD1_16635 [Caulobacteraceae bacterium]
MRQNQTVFANFLCKFGDKDMADYLAEIILPVFTDDKLSRTYGDTSMRFESVKLFMDGETPVLAGKFLYNTVLRRTHIYKEGVGQVEAPDQMESAPSSFFVLSLDNHRLIYFAETQSAPDIKRFQNTVLKFIDVKYEEFIRSERLRIKSGGEKITKAELYNIHHKAELKIVPLSGSDSVRDFIARYEKLQSVKIVVLRRNKDVDPAKTMDELDELAQRAGAPNATLSVANGGGLDPKGVEALVEGVTASGNQLVTLKGVDQEGTPLNGRNDDFSFMPVYPKVPTGTKSRASYLIDKLRSLIKGNNLKVPVGDVSARAKATKLVENQ